MKNLTIICLAIVLMSSRCKKEGYDPVTGLPDATQTGANTFGAMVNGQILIPRFNPSDFGANVFGVYYNGAPLTTPNTVNFHIYGDDRVLNPIRSIDISSSQPLVQGQSYPLQFSTNNPITAYYSYNSTTQYYKVISPLTGQLIITKLDLTNRIISGTFYFDAVSANGDKVSVTDGRFDAKF